MGRRFHKLAIAVEPTRQSTDYTCGPAALRAVLGKEQSEKVLARESGTTAEDGTDLDRLTDTARRHGLDADLRTEMSQDQLRAQLQAGNPVIVNHRAWGDGHYSVALRADDQGVLLMDPKAKTTRQISWPEFERDWRDSDGDEVHAGIVVGEKQAMSKAESSHYREGELGPGVPERKISRLPTIRAPTTWEFSAHPHLAERAGPHIDIRLGNPETGVAHSFVLPKRKELPKPGEMARVIPTYDHTIPYMDYTGRISTEYGKGKVVPGLRAKTEVYHADPREAPGTKLRFNIYEGRTPQEFSLRKDDAGRWYLHNKTQTREKRPDIPAFKPKYKELSFDDVDPAEPTQALMPKLDGAHVIIDLQAGRSPRVFSYRPAKMTDTGLIEHTHKLPGLLEKKVPKALDRTMLRAEVIGVDRKTGKPIPAEQLSGMLNAKVWESRSAQERLGVELKAFPFSVVQHRGKELEEAPFYKKLEVLKQVERLIPALSPPPLATTPKEKLELLNAIKTKSHPLTSEGVVLVEPHSTSAPIKAKIAPDFDVYVREIHPAVSGKTGKPHERAGAISYSWTPRGKIVGQLGGFKHDEARDMLQNPEKYLGRVAKVRASKLFTDERGKPGALFQPRFSEWHLEKGEIEKGAQVTSITTQDQHGVEHTRPFSFVNHVVGSKPPTLGITMLKPGGKTLENVRATGKLKADGKPFTVTKIQDADVVFAMEKASAFRGFVDELEKISITLEQARRATLPLQKKILHIPGSTSLSAFSPVLAKSTARLVGGADPILVSTLRARAGKIVAPKGGAIRSISRQITNPDVLRSASPQDKEMINRIGLLHEGFEVRPGQLEGYHGHMSDVIPLEHNIVSTLPTNLPVSRRFFKALRRGKEDELFERATRGVSGSGLTFGESPRLSRHAVKHIGRRMSHLRAEDVLRAHREYFEKLRKKHGL